MQSVIGQFDDICRKTFSSGWIQLLAVLTEKSSSKVVAHHPDFVPVMALTCLSASFVTTTGPGASMAVIGFPFPQREFQFLIEGCEHVDESFPLFCAGSSRWWLMQDVGG